MFFSADVTPSVTSNDVEFKKRNGLKVVKRETWLLLAILGGHHWKATVKILCRVRNLPCTAGHLYMNYITS